MPADQPDDHRDGGGGGGSGVHHKPHGAGLHLPPASELLEHLAGEVADASLVQAAHAFDGPEGHFRCVQACGCDAAPRCGMRTTMPAPRPRAW